MVSSGFKNAAVVKDVVWVPLFYISINYLYLSVRIAWDNNVYKWKLKGFAFQEPILSIDNFIVLIHNASCHSKLA